MRRVTDIREIQLIELNILKYVAQVCEENDIKYYLYAGTLLGAMRHKGFIPWDDDVDICMPRPDYDRFVKLMRHNESKRFSFKCIENGKKEYNYCYGKMIDNNTIAKEEGKFEGEQLGVWIDIFPLDGVGNNLNKARKIATKNKKYVMQILNIEAGRKMNIKGKVLFLLGRKKLNSIMKHNLKRKKFYKSRYVADIGDLECEYLIYNGASFIGERKELFEGYKFSVPMCSEDILKTLYNDYMKLPPEEERKPSHGIKIWIKEVTD